MRRSKAAEDKILQEQKTRELEERQRREEERRQEEEAERRRKEEAAAALAAAKDKVSWSSRWRCGVGTWANWAAGLQWTPFGFRYRVADSMLEVSRERFQGTVLKAICRSPPKEPREEQEETQEADVKEEEMVVKETKPVQEEKRGIEVWKVEQPRRFWLEFWRQNVPFLSAGQAGGNGGRRAAGGDGTDWEEGDKAGGGGAADRGPQPAGPRGGSAGDDHGRPAEATDLWPQ